MPADMSSHPDREAYKAGLKARIEQALAGPVSTPGTKRNKPAAKHEPKELRLRATPGQPQKQRRAVDHGLPPATPERDAILQRIKRGDERAVSELKDHDIKMGYPYS